MPQLERACCCLTLRTGNLIIGWVHFIGGIIAVASVCSVIAATSAYKPKDPDEKEAKEALLVILYITLAIVCLSPVFGACHLYGSYKNRPGFLLPYLVFGAIQIFLLIVSFIYSAARAPAAGSIVGNLVSIGIDIYLYLIVWSFYKELREGAYPTVQHA